MNHGEQGNELNLIVNLPPSTKVCGGSQCFNTANMMDYTSRLAAIIKQHDPIRPISSGFSAPRSDAWHMEHCPAQGAVRFRLFWGVCVCVCVCVCGVCVCFVFGPHRHTAAVLSLISFL